MIECVAAYTTVTVFFDVRSGTFHGHFRHPVRGLRTPFAGAVFQAQTTGAGYFLGHGGDDGGMVELGGNVR